MTSVATRRSARGRTLDSDGVIRVSTQETTVDAVPADRTKIVANDAPKGSDLPTIDVDAAMSGRVDAAINALPTLEAVSAQEVTRSDGPSVLAGGTNGDRPVEADGRSAGGPTQTHRHRHPPTRPAWAGRPV